MKEEFIKKYNNHEYISNDLYLNVLANYSGAVPSNFNIDTYNDIVLEKEYLLNKKFDIITIKLLKTFRFIKASISYNFLIKLIYRIIFIFKLWFVRILKN